MVSLVQRQVRIYEVYSQQAIGFREGYQVQEAHQSVAEWVQSTEVV